MKQLNLFEKIWEWLLDKFTEFLPESIKRRILYELIDRVLLKKPENERDFWAVSSDDMYNTLRD